MNLEYNIKYILSWVYHNVIQSDVTGAIVRILILIGLVSLLVYREFILFILLCIVVISAEVFLGADTDTVTDADSVMKGLPSLVNVFPRRFVDKDELTTGVSVYENDNHAEAAGREGFSIGIIKGDDSGVDHRRYNKFVEQDSRDFTDKYFSSKQCSIGNSAGGVTMFGSNELLGDSRTAQISGGIYNFVGKWVSNETNDDPSKEKRYTYFKECVYDPITRNDFRAFKKDVYNNINKDIINIQRCLNRFNTNILFDTQTDDAAGYNRRLTKLQDSTVTGASASISYVSLIAGGNDKPADKFSNIQPLNRGNNADNASETTYSALLKKTNDKPISKSEEKQREIEIYGKVYGYRQRIDQILEMMRKQAKNDAANINTINISEEVVEELRLMLSYLAIIERTNAVILFEEKNGYYNTTKTLVTDGKNKLEPLSQMADVRTITGYNNIFRVPLLDDTYNTNDEKRYIYGITFYFDKVVSTTPYA
jgi:hypothetical protein